MRGIRRDRYGYRAYVKVRKLQREKRFPIGTPLKTMQAWRDECRRALKYRPVRNTRGSLAADVEAYLALETVSKLESKASLRSELMAWVELYGDWSREAINRQAVLDAREQWLAAKYAPKTINHRVRALRGLYHRLDGSNASTPCDDVPKLTEPKANPQYVTPAKIRRVASRITDPKMRARFMVLASTGQRPAQLKRAEREDLNPRRRVWLVRPAKGGDRIPVPLTDDMLAAFDALTAAKAWGDFDGSEYAKALYDAGWPTTWEHSTRKRVNVTRPYNLKHTIGITLAESAAEWEDIKDWFGHTDVKTTRIYTGVVAKRLQATGKLLSGRLGWGKKAGSKAGSRKKTA